MNKNSNIPIIILAAGSSTRMGAPKQLLMGKNKPLLQHTIDVCLASNSNQVYLVLGANQKQILAKIDIKECILIDNMQWQKGIGLSIATGVSNIPKSSPGVVITVADQPFLDVAILNTLLTNATSSKANLLLSKYDTGAGPPSYFSSIYFKRLLELNDDSGAKSIVNNHIEDVAYISFPKGDQDIDTKEDADKYLF